MRTVIVAEGKAVAIAGNGVGHLDSLSLTVDVLIGHRFGEPHRPLVGIHFEPPAGVHSQRLGAVDRKLYSPRPGAGRDGEDLLHIAALGS